MYKHTSLSPAAKEIVREQHENYYKTFVELVTSRVKMNKERLSTGRLMGSDLALPRSGKSKLESIRTRIQEKHSGVELNVVNELIQLDQSYRSYFKDWLSEHSVQRMAASMLWKLTEHYALRAELNCCPPNPQSLDAEELIYTKYQVHYQIILSSNLAMGRGVDTIRKNLLALRREYNKLDLTEETPFILGDAFHKPIKFFMELAEDLFNYFHANYLRLDTVSRHLDPSDANTLEMYQKYLEPCEEFDEYLLHNLGYCQCLVAQRVCPEPTKANPPSQRDYRTLQLRAKEKRCARRREKMKSTHLTEEEQMEQEMETLLDFENLDESLGLSADHQLRMNQLSSRLNQLRASGIGDPSEHNERDIVEQMIYALSPSLMPPGYVPPPLNRT